MTAINSYYIALLKEKRIVYMPTCLVIERMARLYGFVAKVQSQVDLARQLKNILFLLRYFAHELRCTSEAYEESRIKFFVGDWKEDRLRSKKLFANLQARIAYFGDYTGSESKRELLEVSQRLGGEWERLNRILDGRCDLDAGGSGGGVGCGNTRYFRSTNSGCWQSIMARSVMSLGGLEECAGPGCYLMLLCYARIKAQIIREVEALQRKYNVTGKFPAEKILCVSDDDVSVSCPTCMTMVDSINRSHHYDTRRRTQTAKPMRRVTIRQAQRRQDSHLAMPRSGLLASALAAFSRGSS